MSKASIDVDNTDKKYCTCGVSLFLMVVALCCAIAAMFNMRIGDIQLGWAALVVMLVAQILDRIELYEK